MTSREKRTLTNRFPEYKMRAYIEQRKIFDSINWTAYRGAISALTDQVRTFVSKPSHNWLPVGLREHRCGLARLGQKFDLTYDSGTINLERDVKHSDRQHRQHYHSPYQFSRTRIAVQQQQLPYARTQRPPRLHATFASTFLGSEATVKILNSLCWTNGRFACGVTPAAGQGRIFSTVKRCGKT
jgi:hypothetical protein